MARDEGVGDYHAIRTCVRSILSAALSVATKSTSLPEERSSSQG